MPEYAWIKQLKPGDVLEERSGSLRVVRTVSRHKHPYSSMGYGPRTSVTFVIKHCSWTHRCYTTLCDNDLITRGFKPIGVSIELDTEFDEKILKEIQNWGKPNLSCCDVEGIS